MEQIRPGDVVGELSFLDGATRYASLVALSDTRVLGLSRSALEGMLDTHPAGPERVAGWDRAVAEIRASNGKLPQRA